MGHKTLNDLAVELREALVELELDDVRVVPSAAGTEPAELLVMVDGVTTPVSVLARADFRPIHASELAPLGRHDAGMVFADRIAQRTRETLRERGWGWLDRRRGHLRLWHPGLRIDSDVAPRVMPDSDPGPRARNPFTPAGIELALWLLVHPDEPASPRGLSRQLGISPGQISNLLGALTAQALLRRDKRPLVPELFWALVEQWKPRRRGLQVWPPVDGLDAPELRHDEWVLTDSLAAVVQGAPVVVGGDHPPDFYVPDERVLRWLLHRSPPADEYAHRAATVAVAPTPLVCDARLASFTNERGTNERGTNERGTNERGTNERGTNERGTNERGTNERGTNERGTNERGTNERGTNERGTNERGTNERGTSEGGTSEGGTSEGGSSGARPEERLAHPVVVALDLATDRSRGREIVSAWDPDPSLGVTRVW